MTKHSPNTGEKKMLTIKKLMTLMDKLEINHKELHKGHTEAMLEWMSTCEICNPKGTKPSQQECLNCKNLAPNKWIAVDMKGNCAECGAELEGKKLFPTQQDICKKCCHHGLRHSYGKKHACHIIDCKCNSFQPPKSSEWEKEFDKLFTNSYAGDSGLGGNYPQEPDYLWATDSPQDIKLFIKSLLSSQKEKFLEIIGEDDKPEQLGFGFDDRVRCNHRNELRAELRKKTKEL